MFDGKVFAFPNGQRTARRAGKIGVKRIFSFPRITSSSPGILATGSAAGPRCRPHIVKGTVTCMNNQTQNQTQNKKAQEAQDKKSQDMQNCKHGSAENKKDSGTH